MHIPNAFSATGMTTIYGYKRVLIPATLWYDGCMKKGYR
jgi:hypothetical protein